MRHIKYTASYDLEHRPQIVRVLIEELTNVRSNFGINNSNGFECEGIAIYAGYRYTPPRGILRTYHLGTRIVRPGSYYRPRVDVLLEDYPKFKACVEKYNARYKGR